MSEEAVKNFPDYPESLKVFNDTMHFISGLENGIVKKAVLYTPGRDEREIYLVAMRGTDRSFDKTDVLGLPVCVKSALAKQNIYYDLIKKKMLAEIPESANVAIAGHSLGGMIAQQLAADAELNKKYNIINLMTIGSPFVKVTGRTCPLRRFADKADFIPWIGFSIKANLVTEKPVFRANGYFGRVVAAHTDSYRNSHSWQEFDCLGVKNGGNVIVFAE